MSSIDKSKILFVCNTPFQLIVACYIRLLYYKQCDADIIISNHINGGKTLSQNTKKTNLFEQVIYVENRKTIQQGTGFLNTLCFLWGYLKESIGNIRLAYGLVHKNDYDELLISNISKFTKLLVWFLSKKNVASTISIFEEGMATYTKEFALQDAPNTLFRKWIDKVGVINRTQKVFLFNPQYLQWSICSGEIVELPKIAQDNHLFKDVVNTIFDYPSTIDKYDKRVIFFEESHALEGFDVPDIAIVDRIAEVVGKENIMVKIHPRNPVNRFARLGYKTNQDTSIPWEVIALNNDFSLHILVTISSGSVVYPYLYFGQQGKTYSLLNCVSERPGLMKTGLGDLMSQVYEDNSNVLCAPEDINDFLRDIHL